MRRGNVVLSMGHDTFVLVLYTLGISGQCLVVIHMIHAARRCQHLVRSAQHAKELEAEEAIRYNHFFQYPIETVDATSELDHLFNTFHVVYKFRGIFHKTQLELSGRESSLARKCDGTLTSEQAILITAAIIVFVTCPTSIRFLICSRHFSDSLIAVKVLGTVSTRLD